MSRSLFSKDLSWKLFSLAIAAAIYFTVKTASRDSTRAARTLELTATLTLLNQPVMVMSSAADVREFKVNPNFVQVAVNGDPDILQALTEKDIRVIVDLTDITLARGLRKRVEVSLPAGVTLVRVSPPTVDVVVPPKSDK